MWHPPHTQIQSDSHFTSRRRKSQHRRPHGVSLKLSYICYTCTASCFNPWRSKCQSLGLVNLCFGTDTWQDGPHTNKSYREPPHPSWQPWRHHECVTVSKQPCYTLGSTWGSRWFKMVQEKHRQSNGVHSRTTLVARGSGKLWGEGIVRIVPGCVFITHVLPCHASSLALPRLILLKKGATCWMLLHVLRHSTKKNAHFATAMRSLWACRTCQELCQALFFRYCRWGPTQMTLRSLSHLAERHGFLGMNLELSAAVSSILLPRMCVCVSCDMAQTSTTNGLRDLHVLLPSHPLCLGASSIHKILLPLWSRDDSGGVGAQSQLLALYVKRSRNATNTCLEARTANTYADLHGWLATRIQLKVDRPEQANQKKATLCWNSFPRKHPQNAQLQHMMGILRAETRSEFFGSSVCSKWPVWAWENADTQLQSAATLVHWQQASEIFSLGNVCCVRSCGYAPSATAFSYISAWRTSVGNRDCRDRSQTQTERNDRNRKLLSSLCLFGASSIHKILLPLWSRDDSGGVGAQSQLLALYVKRSRNATNTCLEARIANTYADLHGWLATRI